jgi:hypothetical protein
MAIPLLKVRTITTALYMVHNADPRLLIRFRFQLFRGFLL